MISISAERIASIEARKHELAEAMAAGNLAPDEFVTPEELAALLAEAGLAVSEMRGVAFSPMKGLHLSSDMSLNYIVTARHRA